MSPRALTKSTASSATTVQPLSNKLISSRLHVASADSKLESDNIVKMATKVPPPPFSKIMAANRAEISVRIQRAVTELNMGSVAIYVDEDRYGQHRWGADESYLLNKAEGATPISAYLDIDQIIKIAKDSGVDAIHPGYGFLSESPQFAQACADAGITFVGPTVENLNTFSDKTSARNAAIAAGVPVVPGSDALKTNDEVNAFVDEVGLPVIIKAAMGGGGKGMRVVRNREDLIPFFESASSEALASFGDGSVFIERFVDRPRHIEIQIIGDGEGNVIHLWERDCSIQRRHQKVIEMAPAWSLPDSLRKELHDYAVNLTSQAKYKNAGTVEFLVDQELRPYFIEVNPRIQVSSEMREGTMLLCISFN
jgi:pyruvate carboxylase